jgi:hypothetical protein
MLKTTNPHHPLFRVRQSKKVGFAFALPTLQFNISEAGYNLINPCYAGYNSFNPCYAAPFID